MRAIAMIIGACLGLLVHILPYWSSTLRHPARLAVAGTTLVPALGGLIHSTPGHGGMAGAERPQIEVCVVVAGGHGAAGRRISVNSKPRFSSGSPNRFIPAPMSPLSNSTPLSGSLKPSPAIAPRSSHVRRNLRVPLTSSPRRGRFVPMQTPV